MNPPHRRQAIARAFDRAEDYANQARIQHRCAQELLSRIQGLPLPNAPRFLELGCGTGFTTRALRERWPGAPILASDLALGMVRRCQRIDWGNPDQGGRVRFVVMDGEWPAVGGNWSLIVANMVLQWFNDPMTALPRLVDLLQPGGWLAFAIPGGETLREWRQLCDLGGIACGMPHLPDAAQWCTWLQPWCRTVRLDSIILEEKHLSALAFLRHLQAIGATSSRYGHRPVSAGDLRRVLRGQEGVTITHQIFFVLATK